MGMRKVGKYEVGRTIGEGTFAKVKFAHDTETGESVAMKVLAKSTILKHKMVDQIKREISIMKIVRHPYIVRLNEVLASRTKIYMVLELVTGGELFDKISIFSLGHQGKLTENESRRYFQQLIDAVDYCHSKGVYHRDLKPENLLLDSNGNLKVSDFGLSALPQQGVGLLHTTCGTPNYVAPEVLGHQGYDGSAADIWSCGVILYVLMAGYLPFDECDLPTLLRKTNAAEFSCPSWFSPGAESLIHRILDPNPKTVTIIRQVYEVAPSLFMIDVRKVSGDTLEYHRVGASYPSEKHRVAVLPFGLIRLLTVKLQFKLPYIVLTLCLLMANHACSSTRISAVDSSTLSGSPVKGPEHLPVLNK
ncbi:unnamed protein product [Spirodela intermedia]|uniref:non-specific serine/threonine protein kinase n=1 Tax=Spirodela intermedia TaxID=51605 RepID=A0A7I8JR32_SPIIN|nr:unnamed protein product [Spirodela intermedia]CAA6672657.1 unnamed protein product [Spirodela intermedia]